MKQVIIEEYDKGILCYIKDIIFKDVRFQKQLCAVFLLYFTGYIFCDPLVEVPLAPVHDELAHDYHHRHQHWEPHQDEGPAEDGEADGVLVDLF